MFVTRSELEKNIVKLLDNEFKAIQAKFSKPMATNHKGIDENILPNFYAYHYTFYAKEVIDAWLALSLWGSGLDYYDEFWTKATKITLGKELYRDHQIKGYKSSLDKAFDLLDAKVILKSHKDDYRIPPYHANIELSTNKNSIKLEPVVYRNLGIIIDSIKPIYLTYTINLTSTINGGAYLGAKFRAMQLVELDFNIEVEGN